MTKDQILKEMRELSDEIPSDTVYGWNIDGEVASAGSGWIEWFLTLYEENSK